MELNPNTIPQSPHWETANNDRYTPTSRQIPLHRGMFSQYTLKRLGAIMKEPGINLEVRTVIGGGDQDCAVVELIADAECKNGV